MKPKFKPFDKVLVRDHDEGYWEPQVYSYHDYAKGHKTLDGNHWQFCIPYEGNEHIWGTKDAPEPKLKKGDAVLVWDKGDFHKKIRIYSRYDGRFHRHVVLDCLFSNGSADEYMFDFAEKYVPATVES